MSTNPASFGTKLAASILKGDVDAVSQFNATNLIPDSTAIESALAIIDNSDWADPDTVSNKAQAWADLFMKLTGFTDFQWHWKSGSSGKFDYETFMDPTSGQWTIVFYDDKLFKRSKGLGPLVLITNDTDGNLAYLVTKYTHGSQYYSDLTPIPNNVKRGKDLAAMLAESATTWILNDIAGAVGKNAWDWQVVSRQRNKFTFNLHIDGSLTAAEEAQDRVKARAKDLNLTISGITIENNSDGPYLVIEASHGLKLFTL